MRAGLVALAGLIALAAACDQAPPRPVNVQFDLAWDTAGAKVEDGHALIATDTGYEVELDRLTLTTYSVELMPCQPLPPPKKAAISFIGTAWAGHQAGHPVTRTNKSGFEAPLTADTLTMDKIPVPDVAYCGAHYLIGRLLDPPPGMDPANTVGFSLRAHGRYHKAGADTWTELTLDTPVAHGILLDFPDTTKGTRFKDGDVLVVTRKLGPMFNGVDFQTMDEAAVVRQILRQVVSGTVVSWHTAG